LTVEQPGRIRIIQGTTPRGRNMPSLRKRLRNWWRGRQLQQVVQPQIQIQFQPQTPMTFRYYRDPDRENLAELQAKQRAMVEQQARQEQAERDRKAEKAKALEDQRLARESEKAQRKAREKAEREQKAQLGNGTLAAAPAPQNVARTGNLLRHASQPMADLDSISRNGAVKDVAGMVVKLTGADHPDDLLAEVLRQLKATGQLSCRAKRAWTTALSILEGKLGSEAHAPSTNGTLVAV